MRICRLRRFASRGLRSDRPIFTLLRVVVVFDHPCFVCCRWFRNQPALITAGGSKLCAMVPKACRVAWIDLQAWALQRMDALGKRMGCGTKTPEHLTIGLRGERAALFHLRTLGYTVVARRWTSAKMRGDVDLIGWDGDWLCFVEVKTRTGRDAMTPAESAVDADKQERMRRMARTYLRRFPEKLRRQVPVRFDIVSVYLQQGGAEFEVFKGAFQSR